MEKVNVLPYIMVLHVYIPFDALIHISEDSRSFYLPNIYLSFTLHLPYIHLTSTLHLPYILFSHIFVPLDALIHISRGSRSLY